MAPQDVAFEAEESWSVDVVEKAIAESYVFLSIPCEVDSSLFFHAFVDILSKYKTGAQLIWWMLNTMGT